MTTQNVNNLLALFHFNLGDCKVVPTTQIVDYKKQKIDVDRQAYFVEINCASVEEARRRALVLAYLTYDVRKHNFVGLTSASMMVNPHIMNKMYKIMDTFNIDLADNHLEQDLKTLVPQQ